MDDFKRKNISIKFRQVILVLILFIQSCIYSSFIDACIFFASSKSITKQLELMAMCSSLVNFLTVKCTTF